MNVLVIGSGGREHALSWAIGRCDSVRSLYVAPGNPGTRGLAEDVLLDAKDHDAVARFCKEKAIDLVVVGPENPLADGLADSLRGEGLAVFGPGRAGALLESSKMYGMRFMERNGVPHPAFAILESPEEAALYMSRSSGPWVLKADGLALGKGVVITGDRDEALTTLNDFFSGKAHGDSGRRVVAQEFLTGRELTAMALTDGNTLFPLPFARDHKRIFDGDRGPNTGGMGAFSPVPLGEEARRSVLEDVLERTLQGLKREGVDYRGVIYAGLMMTKDGPRTLEYNVRFGDPETQCVLPRIKGDFAGALLACAEGGLASFMERNPLSVTDDACAAVVMASGGYPGSYSKEIPVFGLDEAGRGEWAGDPPVFHAGTRAEGGQVATSGGRVLAVPAFGHSIARAGERAYARLRSIRFEGAQYRKDIVDDAR